MSIQNIFVDGMSLMIVCMIGGVEVAKITMRQFVCCGLCVLLFLLMAHPSFVYATIILFF